MFKNDPIGQLPARNHARTQSLVQSQASILANTHTQNGDTGLTACSFMHIDIFIGTISKVSKIKMKLLLRVRFEATNLSFVGSHLWH